MSPGNLIKWRHLKWTFFFILDNFLAVGSWNPENVKAEIYDFGTGNWTTVHDYTYGAVYVAFYDMVYIPATSAYYVIGRVNEKRQDLSKIGMFKNGAWSEAGQLKTTRHVSFYSYCVSKLPVQF